MGAEEVMGRFIIELAGHFEEGEEFFAADEREGIRIKINDLRRSGKGQVIYLLAELGGEGEEGEGLFWCGDFAFVFGGVGG